MRQIEKIVIALLLSCQMGALCLAADVDVATGEELPPKQDFIQFGAGGGRTGNDLMAYKSKDLQLQQMIRDTKGKFQTYSYTDSETGRTLSYNLYMPEGYMPDKSYPMVVFIADASTVGKGLEAPLTQGYGGIIWATAAEQAKHPCFVLVPTYDGVVIDDHNGFKVAEEVEATARLIQSVTTLYNVDKNRIYGTGQSMGCMITMYLAAKHPDLYAAEMFVSGQWDPQVLAPLASQKFFYIAAGGDPKASKGQTDLLPVLKREGAHVSTAVWNAKDTYAALSQAANQEIAKGNPINFATFKKGTVKHTGQSEHMYSFDHAYQIEAVRDWMFKQSRS